MCLKLLIYVEIRAKITKINFTHVRTTEKELSAICLKIIFGKLVLNSEN